MRLRTLILVLGILLSCPGLLLALSPVEKTKILIDEWKGADEPKIELPKIEEAVAPGILKAEAKNHEPILPEEFNKKITLRAQGVSLKTVLNRIGEVTGHTIVYDYEVNSNVLVSTDIRDVGVWQALNTVLFQLNYSFKVKDKTIVILSKETRTFKLNLPPDTQTFSDIISNESWTKPDQLSGSGANTNNSSMSVKVGARVFLESKEDGISLWKDIEMNLANMISPNGKCSFNKVAGIVTVTDSPINLDRISSYIDLVNSETGKQILVEVKILEVTLSDEFSYGIDWNAIYNKLGSIRSLSLSSNFTQNLLSPSFFTLTASSPNDTSGTSGGIAALIKALQAQGKVEVVSQPKIMLLNNQQAMVQVGTVTSYVANTTTTTTQVGLAQTSATTDQVQEGVTLRLMASILDDEILIQLTPVVTTLDELRAINMGQGTTIEAPKISTKSMHSLVKIKDGQTIAVGGLITSNNNKKEQGIPFLDKLPYIGGLFEYKSKTLTRTELVIFITPKILQK